MNDLNVLIERYKKSPYKDNNKVKTLSNIEFCAFLWQLNNGHFELTPYSDKGFLRYFLTGCKNALYCINVLLDQRDKIQTRLFS